mgnify:CR=1 FL=1
MDTQTTSRMRTALCRAICTTVMVHGDGTDKADLAPYTARPARVDLNEKNTARTVGAAASLRLKLDKEDQADDLVFNEIIWKAVKGPDSVMPAPVRAAFVIPAPPKTEKDDDDDDD